MPQVTGDKCVIDGVLYDTVQGAVVAGAQQLAFFANPLNAPLTAVANKTFADTNLTQVGRLEMENTFEIKAISFAIRDTASGAAAVTLADYRAIYRTGHLNLLFGSTTFYHAPLAWFPPATMESQYFSNIAAAATEFKSTHGVGAYQNQLWLEYPIMIQNQESFSVIVEVTGLAAVTDLTVMLSGTLTRPVR
jgi:hypothetical protein